MRNNLATLYTPLSTAPVVPQTLIKGIQRLEPRTSALFMKKWCPGADSNHRHADFQSAALPGSRRKPYVFSTPHSPCALVSNGLL